MQVIRLVGVAAVALAMSSCFTPKPAEGALVCNSAGKACPDGYSCGSDNRCYTPGHGPGVGSDNDMAMGDDLSPTGNSNGEHCTSASDCQSGFCIDGVCCDTACNGQCQACDIGGVVGTCTVLPAGATPHNLRAACAGGGTMCAGSCDGTSADCHYPGTSTVCGAACDGKCDGAGACSAVNGTCPNGYACGPSGCRTSCTVNQDCQPFFQCNGTTCQRVPESDCLDGVDNNGDGLVDCEDPTCTALVECVTDPGAGELGNLTTGSCPAIGFTNLEVQHQSLSASSCSGGCSSCSTTVSCKASITMYSTNTCSTSAGTYVSPGGGGTCVAINPGTYAGTITSLTGSPVSQSCSAFSPPTMATPTWGTTTNFCGSTKQSTSCGAGKVCVAKPAAGNVCVRLAGAGQTCPTGYTTTGANYYTGYTLGTCSCSCNITSSSCSGGAEVLFFHNSTCDSANNGIMGYNTGTGCGGSSCCNNLYFGGAVAFSSGTIASVENYFGNGSGSCTGATQVATQNTLTGASTICCP